MNSIKIKSLVLLLALCSSFYLLQAQETPTNPSEVKVENLSDSQIDAAAKKLQESGLTPEQAKEQAKSEGWSDSQLEQLEDRMKNAAQDDQDQEESDTEEEAEEEIDASKKERLGGGKSSIYGMDLFRGAKPTFTPNMNLPTPTSYTIGVGDAINISLYGASEVNHQLKVNKEGKIKVPYVRSIAVAGMNIGALESQLNAEMRSVYTGLADGSTQMDVTLGEIRSIQVVLTGEVRRPGTYTLPSLATMYNALYAAGGPNSIGGLREIELYRNGELISTIDVYEFLQKGSLPGNKTLKDEDVIMVRPYKKRVKLAGQVKRQLYFDLKEEETFEDLIKYAGGYTDKAYKPHVKVIRYTDREKKVIDLLESQYSQFIPKDGDRYTVQEIYDVFENRVQIYGAVARPGTYELSSGLTLSMLIQKAEGVGNDAHMQQGYINRYKENLEVERIPFNVADILAGLEKDILMQNEDQVYIYSIFDLRDQYKVRIEGEVRSPGVFSYYEGMSVDELIMQAGGFTEGATAKRIEISRRKRGDQEDTTETKSTRAPEIFQIDMTKSLEYIDRDTFELEPYDLVIIRSNPSYETQKYVRIEGEVAYPGLYTISSSTERVSDLVDRAGGLTEAAYPKGASLKRTGSMKAPGNFQRESLSEKYEEQQEKEKERQIKSRITEVGSDLEKTSGKVRLANNYVGMNLQRVLKNTDGADNIYLEDGDVLYVPRELQTIKIHGEVQSPVTTVYHKGQGFKTYIDNAGGFTNRSIKRRAYIVYPDGSSKTASSFLGIKSYPKVEPGSEIYVPQRERSEPLSAQAWIGMGTSFASLAAIIISIFR